MTIDLVKQLECLDVIVKTHPLPTGCHGCSRQFGNSYIIIINSEIPIKKQLDTVFHELAHILLGHHDDRCDLPVSKMEAEVDLFLTNNSYAIVSNDERVDNYESSRRTKVEH